MARNDRYLTKKGLRRLQTELSQLKSERRPEIADRIRKANETGGAVDNAEYDEAKNEQAFTEGRIQELETILSNAVLAPNRKKGQKHIGFGSSVTVVTDVGTRRRYTLVGSVEAAPLDGKISDESPVGQALLGREVGDEVEVKTPSGVMKLKIASIR